MLLVAVLVAGCVRANPNDVAPCCASPSPGTVTVRTNAEAVGTVTYSHSQ